MSRETLVDARSDIAAVALQTPAVISRELLRKRAHGTWKQVRQFFSDPMAFAAGAVILILIVVAAIAPVLAPYDPAATNTGVALSPPSADHLLGTDQLGRDILSRIMFGSRLTLIVSVGAVCFAVLIGCTIGLIAGYLRGRLTDSVLMRSMDVLLAFPGLILAIVMATMLGPGVLSVIIAVGISGAPTFARVTRAATMKETVEEYVVAARSIGGSTMRVLIRHIVPNILGPVVVLATLYLAYAVLTAAALSFLGVGVRPPTPEWGSMVNEGRDFLSFGWWVSVFPGIAIVFFVLAVNILGDRLRDTLDVAGTKEGV